MSLTQVDPISGMRPVVEEDPRSLMEFEAAFAAAT